MKLVPVRPPHLTPTSQANQHGARRSRILILDNDNRTDVFPDITSERESPLFTLQPETALNMQQLVDNSADLHTSTPQTPDGQGVSNFVLDPEMAEGMQRLLDQASSANPPPPAEHVDDAGAGNKVSDCDRTLRSSGKTLNWNPQLDSNNVLQG